MGQAFGVSPELVETLVQDGPDAAPVDDALKPQLASLRQITLDPSKSTDRQAEAVYAAGWKEDALYLAVQTAALYAYISRIFDAAGITPKALFDTPS